MKPKIPKKQLLATIYVEALNSEELADALISVYLAFSEAELYKEWGRC